MLTSRLVRLSRLPLQVSERSVLGALLGFALAARILIAFVLPPWQSPDEPKHFEYVRLLVDRREQLWAERRLLQAPHWTGRLENAGDMDAALESTVISSMDTHHFWAYLGSAAPANRPSNFFDIWQYSGTQLHRPSLYYFVLSPILLLFHDRSLEAQLISLRVFSAILGALAVVLTYYAAREVLPGDRFLPAVSAAFVAALPMHIFISGAVNSDNLVSLAGSAVALVIARGFRRGWTLAGFGWLFCSLLLALASKRTGVGLIPVVLISILAYLVALRRRVLAVVVGCAVAASAMALLVVDRSAAFGRLYSVAIDYGTNGENQIRQLGAISLQSAEVRRLIEGHLVWLFKSFWGIFGWFNVPLDDLLYQILGVCTLVSLLALATWLAHRLFIERTSAPLGRQGLAILALYALAALSMVLLAEAERLPYLSSNEIPQGRYLFAAVTPIAVIFALGLRSLFSRRLLGTSYPIALCLMAFAALDVLVYLRYIQPFYWSRPF